MNDTALIAETADFVKEKMMGEGTGHDWWHVYRVWQLTKTIADNEPQVNKVVVELGALLHDIADWKFAGGNLEAGPKAAREWLKSRRASEEVITRVEDIVRNTSFKGAKVALSLDAIEAKIVSDADKLDAMGAIGVARAFAYGGSKHRPLYNPDQKPVMHASFEEYKAKGVTHTINHFYEKLLLLKDIMQTETGKQLAERRHRYMEEFLTEFHKEWNSGQQS